MIQFLTYHIEFVLLVDEAGEAVAEHGTAGQGEIRVKDGSVSGVSHSQGAVKTWPEHPQEQGTWRMDWVKWNAHGNMATEERIGSQ